ncbi:MAG: selenocysteine-specific translation elongation factor [Candidatus Coatesbacteria bacterium]|nr:selenocysteine-specific translation elongation factor [Candidatus Coatesbacteria bacterium]
MIEAETFGASPQPVSLILGTAGHIDHGKTELVKSLTGINTDRLKEEQERGISIDLGFAYLDLPNGRRIGIVDVPGHERFIKAMVAGASGIDIVMFVIAADEGVMPQSVEHLDVCRFLGVRSGLVALTKADLVSEEDVELALEDVRDFVRGTFLESARVILTSARTRQGLEALTAEIVRLVDAVPGRSVSGTFRMPIDRSFTIQGFGTVVTGTVISGRAAVGSAVEIYPHGITTKIRRIETHNTLVEEAAAGQRTAINLPKVTKAAITRGDVLSVPGRLSADYVFDVHVLLNLSKRAELKSGARIRLHVGTKEALGRIWPIGEETFKPGFDGFAQVRLEERIVALCSDRFVLRTYSPAQVIGGGSVLTIGSRRRFGQRAALVEQLEMMKDGSEADRIGILVRSMFPRPPDASEVATQLGLQNDRAESVIGSLCDRGVLVRLSSTPERFLHSADVRQLEEALLSELRKYHESFPLRAGMQERELVSKVKHPTLKEFFADILRRLVSSGEVTSGDALLRLASHSSSLTDRQNQIGAVVRKRLETSGVNPVETAVILNEAQSEIPGASAADVREVINYLVQSKEAVRISPEFLLSTAGLESIARTVANHLSKNKTMTVGTARDILKSSRRFVVPVLEYLDRVGITRREGDVRVRGASGLESLE